VNRITASRARLEAADSLPATLDAAYEAFETILAVLRHHQERAGHGFPAFVLAAGEAANGRDRVAEAPSLPPPAAAPATGDVLGACAWGHVAAEAAALSHALVNSLLIAAGTASPADQDTCRHAVAHAARIWSLLAGASRT
jgi:hypothetical protein